MVSEWRTASSASRLWCTTTRGSTRDSTCSWTATSAGGHKGGVERAGGQGFDYFNLCHRYKLIHHTSILMTLVSMSSAAWRKQ